MLYNKFYLCFLRLIGIEVYLLCIIFAILCVSNLSCSYSRNDLLNHSIKYKVIPLVCEFDSSNLVIKNKLKSIEISCETLDTSLWMICGKKVKKIKCNYFDNQVQTLYTGVNCNHEIIIISVDKKIIGKIPIYDSYPNIRVGLSNNMKDYEFIDDFKYYFYIRYKKDFTIN